MARLPNPGSDDGTWGAVLNDFLQQSHKTDGTLKPTSLNASGALLASQNLSDVAAAETARTNLGLGTAATYPDTEFNRHRVAKYAHTGEISGFVRMWNPAAWDGGAGDVDVLMPSVQRLLKMVECGLRLQQKEQPVLSNRCFLIQVKSTET